jgi:hypothetical protein
MAATGKSVRLDNLRTERIAAGLSVTRLAQLSNTSDLLINTLEALTLASGPRIAGCCTPDEAARIANALSVTLVTLGAVQHGG